MKKCPFCAEDIQEEAIKCKHCGEFLDGRSSQVAAAQKLPWYFRSSFIILAVCSVGPLALPLLWWRPGTPRVWKIALTVAILILSWVLYQATMASLRSIMESYKLLEGL